jgi:hypothetical protein
MRKSLLSCCGDTAFLSIRRTCWVRRGPSLRDLIFILAAYPAPRRWAKVARPCGTLVRRGVNLHAAKGAMSEHSAINACLPCRELRVKRREGC